MAAPVATIEAQHTDMIHDCQFDYYSKKLATCSSDTTIKIFDVNGDIYHCSKTITDHTAPVWQVAWAHPKFGVILASCSYDGCVKVHKEVTPGNWQKIYDYKLAEASVNSIAFAPHEFGLVLSCAASDGKVAIIEYKNNMWVERFFQNDTLGCNSVSWAPYHGVTSHSPDNNGALIYRLVTGSCDNVVRIWRWIEGSSESAWVEEPKTVQSPHTDWVRDVAWAPNSALPYSVFASCSEDKSVFVWRQKEKSSGLWEPSLLRNFEAPVWRLSWSLTGTVLAISTADHRVSLWKQSVDESWVQISSLADGE